MSSMNPKTEQMWQAYIDGEMSATEMAAFEESLSASERQLLASDVKFERALSDRLAEDATCPCDVWERTKTLLKSQTENSGDIVPFTRSRYQYYGTIVAAAMITLMVSWLIPAFTGPSAPVILAEGTVDELAALSELNNPSHEQVQQYMQQNNYKIRLVEINTMRIVQVHSGVKLLGAARSNKNNVIELYFACCGHPVKIILAERDTPEACDIGHALGQDNDLQDVRLVGNYVAGIVGKHPSVGLLDIFAGQHQ